ncbi:MAG TPA: DUF1425 domain-containing protein [Planctomycetota bacterium]|nr:DUF1425 domain-containing protein [Planctomycetota bacterium]
MPTLTRSPRRRVALAVVLAAPLALLGCFGPSGLDKVQFLGEVGQYLEVKDVERDNSGASLRALVDLRNKSGKSVSIETRYEWYDAEGGQVSQTTTFWEPATLMAGERRQFSALANSPNATDFRFSVRER